MLLFRQYFGSCLLNQLLQFSEILFIVIVKRMVNATMCGIFFWEFIMWHYLLTKIVPNTLYTLLLDLGLS